MNQQSVKQRQIMSRAPLAPYTVAFRGYDKEDMRPYWYFPGGIKSECLREGCKRFIAWLEKIGFETSAMSVEEIVRNQQVVTSEG